MSRRGLLLFALMSVVWGIPYLLIKVAVRHLDPVLIVEGRTAIGAILLLPLAFREGRLRPILAVWKPLLAYTVAEMAIPWYLLPTAEERLPSSLTGLLVAAVPLIAVLLAALTGHRDQVDRRRLGGLLVGLVGVAVLLGFDVSHGDLRAVGEVLVVAVGYATGPLLAARYFREQSSLALSAVSLTVVAVAYLPLAIARHPAHVPPGNVVASVVGLGVICTALAFVAFFELIKEIGSTRATVITYLNPVVAVVLGVVFLGESITIGTLVGFALILAGSRFSTAASVTRPVEAP